MKTLYRQPWEAGREAEGVQAVTINTEVSFKVGKLFESFEKLEKKLKEYEQNHLSSFGSEIQGRLKQQENVSTGLLNLECRPEPIHTFMCKDI